MVASACGGGSRPATDGGHGGIDAPATPIDAGSGDVFRVEVTSTAGPFVIELHRDWSPNGVDHFRELIDAQFYDECRFFRVVPGFVVQFGINGDPTTNAMWNTMRIPDDPVVQSNTRGYVSFAKTASPDSRTTQLFINYGNNANLDAMGFSPIGMVVSGMDSVDAIDAEYGQMPDQTLIQTDGNAYLDATFPNLDAIQTARVAP